MTTSAQSAPTVPSTSQIRRTRALTVLVATLAAVVAWAVADPVAGLGLTVHGSSSGTTTRIEAPQVVAASLAAGLAAWALLAVLEWRIHKADTARTAWTTVAVIVLLLSLAGPLGATSVTAATALACLHLIVGGVLIIGLRRSTRR